MDARDSGVYRQQLKYHFLNHVKNPKLQVSDDTSTSTVKRTSMTKSSELAHLQQQVTSQHFKDNSFRTQKIPEYENYHQHQRRQASRSSGGDADRALYDAHLPGHLGQADSYRGSSYDDNNIFSHHCQSKSKPTPALPMPSNVNQHKFHPDDANMFLYDTDSNIGGGGPGSEESSKSQKSSKTVVSKKSSQDLRKMVKSQCKLHEVIDETLKQMCTEPDPMSEGADCRKVQSGQLGMQKPPGSCKRCTDKIFTRSSQKDVMTEISKGDFLECRSGETLTISVDDVVNSKVINPMIRKLQRMYLNNLREEMSLMEDLERLPHKVNEVYKATIFKQKE